MQREWSNCSVLLAGNRPLSRFPLRLPIESLLSRGLAGLSPSQRSFLSTYQLLVLPLLLVMAISLCSMLYRKCPRVMGEIIAVRKLLAGGTLSVVSSLYGADVGLHLHYSLLTTKSVFPPKELLLDPFYPVHFSVALSGLAIGLHTLRILREKRSTLAALLEIEGVYFSMFFFVLSSSIPSAEHAWSLKNVLLCLSALTTCTTLQAIGMSWGVSLFHEFGIHSARFISFLRRVITQLLIYGQNQTSKVYNRIKLLVHTTVRFIRAVITRIRKGDRLSRLFRAVFLNPICQLKQSLMDILYPFAVQSLQNAHVLTSFAAFYGSLYLRAFFCKMLHAWKLIVYTSCRHGKYFVCDILIPAVSFVWTEMSILCTLLFNFIWDIVLSIFLTLRNAMVIPFGKFCIRFLRALAVSLQKLCTYSIEFIGNIFHYARENFIIPTGKLFNTFYHTLLHVLSDLLSRFSRLVCRVFRAVKCLAAWIYDHVVLVLNRILIWGRWVCRKLVNCIVKPLLNGIIGIIKSLVMKFCTFLWKFSFATLLVCFGVKYWFNARESCGSWASNGQSVMSILDIFGLALGGYVCILTGSLLLVAKCPQFPKQIEIICLLTACYQNLDFFLFRVIQIAFIQCQRISLTIFRSLNKFLSVVWKAAFDAIDFLLTVIVNISRSCSISMFTKILKPCWKAVVDGAYIIWNSPFLSFVCSFAVMGFAFYCHTNEIRLDTHLYEIMRKCSLFLESCGNALATIRQTVIIGNDLLVTGVGEIAKSVPVENVWLTSVNQSLWKLSEVPSLGWTLYLSHLCGGSLSSHLNTDPKVFMRSTMKLIYYPLLASFLISSISFVNIGFFQTSYILSFGYFYAFYTGIGAIFLMIEMKRLHSAPSVQVWNASRRGYRRVASVEPNPLIRPDHQPVPSAPPLVANKIDLAPFEYLKLIPPPATVFECAECPICMDDLVYSKGRPPCEAVSRNARKELCLPCGHMYHEDCIFDWLHENAHCPSCREVVSPNKHSSSFTDSTHSLLQDAFL